MRTITDFRISGSRNYFQKAALLGAAIIGLLLSVWSFNLNGVSGSSPAAGNSVPPEPEPGGGPYNLNPHLEILQDPSGELDISRVISPEYEGEFEPHGKERAPTYSYTDSALWVRLQLPELSPEEQWYLEVDYPVLHRVEFYAPEEGGGYTRSETGGVLPFDTREVEHRSFVFNLSRDVDAERPFFLRVETGSAMIIPVNLWDARSFVGSAEREYLWLGLYYGIILIIICYTLLLFIFSRQRNYLYYAFFIFSSGLFMFTFNGLSLQYLWPGNPWWGLEAVNFFIFLGASAGFLFTNRILPVKNHFLILDRLLKITGIFAAFMLPFTLLLDFTFMMQLGIATVLFGPLIILPSAALCWYKKHRPALFLFWGWAIFVAGMILMSFRSLGLLPDAFITEYGAQLGLFVKIIFIFIGLADHMNILRREREYLTEDLQRRVQEVQSVRSAFLFAQIKPHFLFNALNTISYFARVDADRAGELIGDLSTYLRRSFDFKEVPSMIPLGEELKLVQAYVNIEKARFSGQFEVEYRVEVPRETRILPFSIQPLVENALVHGLRRREGGTGKVTVICAEGREGTRVRVEDNGVGIPEEELSGLLEKKESSGIGLWNIHSRLQTVFGSGLQITSRKGEGTAVEFFVPVDS